ncbi:sugar phosphate isomerase/epimerase family protein [Saccharicrinis fermentans]|uniref:Xylose isomerase-like TIM barrel n=1 Tax=Saccharicrinis fermentans DSM 9555 = JCM 21142 TaxID=869213 RepID=W7YE12_9BACT|nr:TIM barrel protein [Saccharicrinis fermentans]GAF02701.1 xylose isomerase-like TIM barrel [Saccharicrinis fermentans DSM 9555 = JCM 21142]
MDIKYICAFWGSESLMPKMFINKVMSAGYDGVEMNVTPNPDFEKELKETLDNTGLIFIAQQWLPPKDESVEDYRERMLRRLRFLASLKPLFINTHTGKDFFSFKDNSSLIESCRQFTEETGIPLVHETHRGRFTHHAFGLLPYLEKYPDLQLNADFSHFCNVSESLLYDQEHVLEKIYPHCRYIHARVGFDQSAQVNYPFAPEWKTNLDRFVAWWQHIVNLARERGEEVFYVCPEFGPYPYMQRLPFTQKEVADQWDINCEMMAYLKNNLH